MPIKKSMSITRMKMQFKFLQSIYQNYSRIRNINILTAIVKLSHLINITSEKTKDRVDIANKFYKRCK